MYTYQEGKKLFDDLKKNNTTKSFFDYSIHVLRWSCAARKD